ncbi:MAG: hypothetical protein WA814_00855 [Candidatus Baltobacteraceae bacterium]
MPATRSDADIVNDAIARFEPALARKIRGVRAALRKRFPTAYELVYDNYNFFVIGYCASEKPSTCVVSLAADRNGVGLAFYRGASLPDPLGLLQGGGQQNRFIRLTEGAQTLARPEVVALVDVAERLAPVAMRASGRVVTVLRSVSVKQRPRRFV